MSSLNSSFGSSFDEFVKMDSISVSSYLGRLILRTHHDEDTASLAAIYSDPLSKKHLPFLQPPNGWGNKKERIEQKIWTEQDFADRVKVQNETRANGKSCVFNIILLTSASNEKHNRCIGTTGFVKIDDNIGYLGIITHKDTMRMGYATEALYTSIAFAFKRLGINKIVLQTSEKNEEMRGWCEKTAGLKLIHKKPMEINDHKFIECQYEFTVDEWNNTIKEKLESKMNNIKCS